MAPTLYRIILQVDNLDRAEELYRTRCFVDEHTLFAGK